MQNLDGALETRRAWYVISRRCWQTSPTSAGKRGARFVVIALAAYLLWSGPHLIFHTAHRHAVSALSVAYGSCSGAGDPRGPESGGDACDDCDRRTVTMASQVHCPGESGRAGRDRDPVARHADLETASIPTELDFGRYRHAQEVTDSMSIETVDTRASC